VFIVRSNLFKPFHGYRDPLGRSRQNVFKSFENISIQIPHSSSKKRLNVLVLIVLSNLFKGIRGYRNPLALKRMNMLLRTFLAIVQQTFESATVTVNLLKSV